MSRLERLRALCDLAASGSCCDSDPAKLERWGHDLDCDCWAEMSSAAALALPDLLAVVEELRSALPLIEASGFYPGPLRAALERWS